MSEYTSKKKRKAIIIVFGSVNKFRSANFLNIISYGAGVSRSNIAVQFVHRNALTRAPRHIKSVFTSTFINQVAITLFMKMGTWEVHGKVFWRIAKKSPSLSLF